MLINVKGILVHTVDESIIIIHELNHHLFETIIPRVFPTACCCRYNIILSKQTRSQLSHESQYKSMSCITTFTDICQSFSPMHHIVQITTILEVHQTLLHVSCSNNT
jgi:hypothetical protein